MDQKIETPVIDNKTNAVIVNKIGKPKKREVKIMPGEAIELDPDSDSDTEIAVAILT